MVDQIWTIRRASPSGGKAGKGFNKTSTIQVLDYNNFLRKQFRFVVNDFASEQKARDKARKFVRDMIAKEKAV